MNTPVDVPAQVSVWRALIRGWALWLPVIVLNALVQALLVTGDPVPTTSWTFAALVAASAIALVLTVATLAVGARTAVNGRRGWTADSLPGPRLIGWTLGLGVVIGAVAVLFPWVTPVLLVLGALPLTAVADGRPAGHCAAMFRHAPFRTTTTLLGLALLAMLSWPVALLLGFFITGPVAAAVTWLWFGLVATLVSHTWAAAGRATAI